MCPQRATAGLRRPAAELTDGSQGNHSASNSNPVNDTSNPVQPTDRVAMEISSSPPMTDLERESAVSWLTEDVQELQYPEDREMQQPIKEKQEDEETEADGGECDYLVFEIGEREERKSNGKKMGKGAEEEGDDETGGREILGRKEEGERANVEENLVEDPWKDDNRREGKEEDGGMMGTVEADAAAESLFLSDGPSLSLSPQEQLMESRLPEKVADQDDLGACLQAEFAVVYPDSDAGDDQWAAFTASDATHQKEGAGELSGIIHDDREKREEGGRREDEEREELEEQKEEDVEMSCREGDYDEDQMTSRSGGVFMRSPSFSSTASSTDPDKRVRPLTGCFSLTTVLIITPLVN